MFFSVLRDEGYTRFADRFDRILGKALNAIPMDETSVDGCNNLWAPFSEADDAWDPATGDKNSRYFSFLPLFQRQSASMLEK